MQTSHVARKRRFFEVCLVAYKQQPWSIENVFLLLLLFCSKLVAIGDTMRGLVTLKRSSELRLKVLSFVGTHKMRELSDLNIKVGEPLNYNHGKF